MSLPTELNESAPWCARCTGSPRCSPGRKQRRRLLLLMLLPLLLIACGSQPVPPRTQIVVIEPPEAMMADCPRPGADLSTNQAITDSLIACNAQIVRCNLSRQSAREYIEDAKKRAEDAH